VSDGLGYLPEATGCLRRDAGVMTMYLSNRDVRPTGHEVCEFIEPTDEPAAEPGPGTREIDDETDETIEP